MFDVCNLINRFAAAGLVLKKALRHFGSNADVFGIDIKRTVGGSTRCEWFEFWPGHDANRVEVVGIDSNIKQLVLLVKEEKRTFTEIVKKSRWMRGQPTGVKILKETADSWTIERSTPGNSRRFLMGVDERQLFMCQLRGSINSVRDAHDSLKAPQVKTAEGNLGRSTRQGEWFFLPLSEGDRSMINMALKSKTSICLKKARIARTANESNHSRSGKPHVADEVLFLREPVLKHGFPVREAAVYVRGNVKHPDHATVKFAEWRKVIRNTEQQPLRGGTLLGGTWID